MATVLFETGDDLDETNLREWLLQSNLSNHVESGATINPNFGADEITVEASKAYLTYSSGIYAVKPDQTTLSLPAPSGTNLVFIAYDPGTDDSATYEIATSASNVADPKLQIATVDGAGETVNEENREPDVSFNDATIAALTLSGAMDAAGYDISNVGALTGNSLEATSTLTDASGTDHTGALADLTAPGGVLVSSQLPQLSITSVDVVADQTARLALDAEEGDFAIQQDNDTSYVLSTNDPAVDSNWIEIDFDAVSAIAGQAIAPSSVDTNRIENADYNEAAPTTTNASGSTNVDVSAANMREIEVDGDVTITFSNVSTDPEGNNLLLRFYDDDATGPHTITWPASVEWSDGTVRDTVDSDGELIISLASFDGGTTWKAGRFGRNFA